MISFISAVAALLCALLAVPTSVFLMMVCRGGCNGSGLPYALSECVVGLMSLYFVRESWRAFPAAAVWVRVSSALLLLPSVTVASAAVLIGLAVVAQVLI